MTRPIIGVLSALLMLSAATLPAAAQNKGGGKNAKSGPSQSQEVFEALGQIQVGLIPDYPENALCPQVSSFFGSGVRYDGSTRMNDHFGFHNGIDISLAEGTGLIAIADGEVVHAGAGGMLVGNYVWLRHRPEDTGLPVYLFTRYQHMRDRTPLAVGTRVRIGDTIGAAGKTGTVGGYFGPTGYSHLHLLVFAAASPDFAIRDAVVVANDERRYLDPLAIYLKNLTATVDNAALRDLPDAQKHVAIPYRTVGGSSAPSGTRLVWPVMCVER